MSDLVMTFSEYADYDALGLAELVRRKEVTPEELAQLAQAAVERLNPQLNAVIEVWPDRVERCDPDADLNRPFAGVPFLLKDIGAAEKGRPQEMGSRLCKGRLSPFTTELTKKFKKAGLNIMGRTTCPDNAFTFDSESQLHGATHNPWKPGFIAGGSSSGAASAVAAGILPMAHASDGAGSTRMPASICGLVGLKPSRGRLSLAPIADEHTFMEAVEGVVSRTVRDTAVLFDHISGSEVGEFMHAAPPKRPYAEELRDPQKYRIAVSLEPWGAYRAKPHLLAEVEKTAGLLTGLGHEVVEATPPIDFERFFEAFTLNWIGSTLTLEMQAEEMGVQLSTDHLEPVLFEHVVRAREISLRRWMEKDHTIMAITRELDDFFRENRIDLVLTPVMAIDTPELGNSYSLSHTGMTLDEWMDNLWQAIPYTPLANATGVPAISLPLAREGNGLPLGMQFFGRWGSEDKLLNLAAQLEAAQPWITQVPPVHVSKL